MNDEGKQQREQPLLGLQCHDPRSAAKAIGEKSADHPEHQDWPERRKVHDADIRAWMPGRLGELVNEAAKHHGLHPRADV